MFFCQIAATVTFLLIRHQVIVADQDNVTFTENNLTTEDYEDEDVSFIPADYDRYSPPKDAGAIIMVNINSIVMDKNYQYCNLTFGAKFKWKDERLFGENPSWWKNSAFNRTDEKVENMWSPVFILGYNAIREEGITFRHRFIEYRNKTAKVNYNHEAIVYMRSNLQLTLAAKPNFQKFPADRHQYVLRLFPDIPKRQEYSRSYVVGLISQLDKDLVFGIDVKGMNLNDATKHMPTSINNLAVTINFQRRIGNYIVQSYIPSGLFIILSWLSMFLPLDIATERVALCTATLLTLTTFTGSVKLSVPETSYMTGLDLWMVVSTLFIFLILAENICVLRILAKKSENVLRTGIFEGIAKATMKIHVAEILKSETENVTSSTSTQKLNAVEEIGETHPIKVYKPEEWRTLARKLDIISAVVIAVLWIIFNVIYWIWLFANEDLFPDSAPVKVLQISGDDEKFTLDSSI